jgi:Ca-activated chloride channel family protein
MRFNVDLLAFPGALWLALGILAVATFSGVLVWASMRRARAEKRFGEPKLVAGLVTYDATGRRAVKGVLLVVALALALIAFARPQYGSGTRFIPATNVDVVLVVDYSKSMYARDVQPSRIARAKAEIAKLIEGLPGARFAAVAFAGEPMSFPLTSDGAAIAQFIRQLDPNDMPIGGTATARALERGRELLAHDPRSRDHVRVMVLITDGEDLEGDPVKVAEECAAEGTIIHVVQIGGLAPEVIPDVDESGKVIGIRHDLEGKPLTTELSAEGEAQLTKIATTTNGTIVRSEGGETGILTIAQRLQKMMKEELSEKVETVYADVFDVPLGLCLFLLALESIVFEARRRKVGVAA